MVLNITFIMLMNLQKSYKLDSILSFIFAGEEKGLEKLDTSGYSKVKHLMSGGVGSEPGNQTLVPHTTLNCYEGKCCVCASEDKTN